MVTQESGRLTLTVKKAMDILDCLGEEESPRTGSSRRWARAAMFGAPIFDHQGRPVAAVSLSGPAFRLTRERAEGLSSAVRRTALKISQQMGYPGSERTG